MKQFITLITLFIAAPAMTAPWFDGTPDFADRESRELAARVLEAHGGMQAMEQSKSLQFKFFTKMIGNPNAFYSFEAVDLETGNAYVEWPFWDSSMALVDGELWSHRWPMPLPPGFFIRLTTSFITLPWQLHHDAANVGPVHQARLPNDETLYNVLRITFDVRTPSMPGTYYDLYVDTETSLMKGIGFDINHPGMVANPNQPLGPNFHVFGDYRQYKGLKLPTFYLSYGNAGNTDNESNAYHFAWDLSLDRAFDPEWLTPPDGAKHDSVSMNWWQMDGEGAPPAAQVSSAKGGSR